MSQALLVSSGYRIHKTKSLPSGSLHSRRKRQIDKFMVGALARNKAEREYRSGMWVVAVLYRVLRQALIDEEVFE